MILEVIHQIAKIRDKEIPVTCLCPFVAAVVKQKKKKIPQLFVIWRYLEGMV